ncbi:MAG TPA: hypothetical protein PKW33_17285 [Anaerolineaceae bacterium]|nr:hypothetical protein [Anaerolineaceae bacterium]HPN53354.1 hypothetical protein [Anaerolineaceae bacterium]
MADQKNNRSIQNYGQGFFGGITQEAKLIVRLMGDKRVNLLLKAMPVATLAYLIIPDILPGPIDDAALIWLGSYLFVELCPPDVVDEHRQRLREEWELKNGVTPVDKKDNPDEDVVDAEYREIK